MRRASQIVLRTSSTFKSHSKILDELRYQISDKSFMINVTSNIHSKKDLEKLLKWVQEDKKYMSPYTREKVDDLAIPIGGFILSSFSIAGGICLAYIGNFLVHIPMLGEFYQTFCEFGSFYAISLGCIGTMISIPAIPIYIIRCRMAIKNDQKDVYYETAWKNYRQLKKLVKDSNAIHKKD